MAINYYFYPPFFVIDPQTSFSKAWEEFCRRLLNLELKTTAIHRRTPPDRGIDLFWQAQGIAYQCKAVESGLSKNFQLAHVKKSIETAQAYQNQIGWQKYALCTNVDLTGVQIDKLEKMLPGIEILPNGYWTDLCMRFHEQVSDRFRILVSVPSKHVQRAIQALYPLHLHTYLSQVEDAQNISFTHILLYLDSYKDIFDIPIPSTFTAREVLLLLRELFELPGPRRIQEHNITVSLEYSLHTGNKKIPAQLKLSDLQTDNRHLITLQKTIIWSDNGRQTQAIDLESSSAVPLKKPQMPISLAQKQAIERYKQSFDEAVQKAAVRFSQN